jgi:hypothetical protein
MSLISAVVLVILAKRKVRDIIEIDRRAVAIGRRRVDSFPWSVIGAADNGGHHGENDRWRGV